MTAIAAARRLIRATARRAQRRDEGFTLVAVVAVAAVVLLLAGTVITAAVRSDAAAGRDRGRTQALAAAEAGLDEKLVALRGITPQTQRALCAPSAAEVWSSPGRSTVTVTPTFFTASGARVTDSGEENSIPCSVGLTETTSVTSVEVRSSADHTVGGTTARRAVKAVVTLAAPPGDSSAVFDKAMFSDEAFLGGGNLRSNDGDIYTNENFVCEGNAGPARSSIIAQGNITLRGNCEVGGDVISGGTVTCTGNAKVRGNVFAARDAVMDGNCVLEKGLSAAGTYTCADGVVRGDVSSAGTGRNGMSGNCVLKGSATFEGSFSLSGNTTVDGPVTSFTQAWSEVSGNAKVFSSSVVRGDVRGDVTRAFPGGVTQRTSPTTSRPVTPKAPPRQEMPVLGYDADDVASRALIVYKPTECTVRGKLSVNTSTVIDARNCNTLTFTDNSELDLNADLTIYAKNVSTSGNFEVDGRGRGPYNLRIIVPASAGAGAVCARGGGDIDFSGNTTFDNKVKVFLYAPGTVLLSGNVTVNGAVYACRGKFEGNSTINYTKSALPPVPGGGSGAGYTLGPVAKVDVSVR